VNVFAWDSLTADDYLGISTGVDGDNDCLLVRVRDFRGPGREQITWGFILEEFLACESDLVVFDVREATYPVTNAGLAATFQEMAAALPTARIAILLNHAQKEAMEFACAAANAAGHACRCSANESDLVDWVRSRSTEEAHKKNPGASPLQGFRSPCAAASYFGGMRAPASRRTHSALM